MWVCLNYDLLFVCEIWWDWRDLLFDFVLGLFVWFKWIEEEIGGFRGKFVCIIRVFWGECGFGCVVCDVCVVDVIWRLFWGWKFVFVWDGCGDCGVWVSWFFCFYSFWFFSEWVVFYWLGWWCIFYYCLFRMLCENYWFGFFIKWVVFCFCSDFL